MAKSGCSGVLYSNCGWALRQAGGRGRGDTHRLNHSSIYLDLLLKRVASYGSFQNWVQSESPLRNDHFWEKHPGVLLAFIRRRSPMCTWTLCGAVHRGVTRSAVGVTLDRRLNAIDPRG